VLAVLAEKSHTSPPPAHGVPAWVRSFVPHWLVLLEATAPGRPQRLDCFIEQIVAGATVSRSRGLDLLASPPCTSSGGPCSQAASGNQRPRAATWKRRRMGRPGPASVHVESAAEPLNKSIASGVQAKRSGSSARSCGGVVEPPSRLLHDHTGRGGAVFAPAPPSRITPAGAPSSSPARPLASRSATHRFRKVGLVERIAPFVQAHCRAVVELLAIRGDSESHSRPQAFTTPDPPPASSPPLIARCLEGLHRQSKRGLGLA